MISKIGKFDKGKCFLFILGLALLAGWFYWFAYRPARIKHDCSWVKRHKNAIPARPAMTVEELKAKEIIVDCDKETEDTLSR